MNHQPRKRLSPAEIARLYTHLQPTQPTRPLSHVFFASAPVRYGSGVFCCTRTYSSMTFLLISYLVRVLWNGGSVFCCTILEQQHGVSSYSQHICPVDRQQYDVLCSSSSNMTFPSSPFRYIITVCTLISHPNDHYIFEEEGYHHVSVLWIDLQRHRPSQATGLA